MIDGHKFGATLSYRNKWREDTHLAYGIVTLNIDVSHLISERQVRVSRYGIWGSKDYYLSTEDLTDQWYTIDEPIYKATFETYSSDYIGEDSGWGTLFFTLPDGTVVEKSVDIDGNTENMKYLMLSPEDEQNNYLTTYILTPKE